MEKIARKEIVVHLEINKIISDVQHGFVQGKSCQTQLLILLSNSGQNGWRKETHLTACMLTTGKLSIRSHTSD